MSDTPKPLGQMSASYEAIIAYIRAYEAEEAA